MSLYNSSFLELEDFKHAGDGDYTAAFCRARDHCLEEEVGGNLLLPSGRLCIDDTIDLDFCSDDSSYDSIIGLNLTGPGSGSCQLYWTKGTNDPMFKVRSTKNGAGPIRKLHWKGFSVGTSVPNTGTFFKGEYIGQSKFEDILSFHFDQHYELQDSLIVNFDRVMAAWGRRGLYAHKGDFTYPNSINFTNTSSIGGMSEWGVIIDRGSMFSMDGGSTCENNGLGTGEDKGGIKLIYPGMEGGVGASINKVYFEGNKGLGDIYYIASAATQSSFSVTDCIFNRKTGSATNNIRIDTDTGYKPVELYHFGNNFTYFDGDYTPDASRKNIAKYGGGPVLFHGHSKFRSDLEAPDFANDLPFASIIFNGGTLAQARNNNVYTIVRHAAGQYSVFFMIPSRGTHFVEAITNGAHVHQLYNEDASMIRLHFLNLNGVAVDPETIRLRIFC